MWIRELAREAEREERFENTFACYQIYKYREKGRVRKRLRLQVRDKYNPIMLLLKDSRGFMRAILSSVSNTFTLKCCGSMQAQW